MLSEPICLRVKGPFACFTMPEFHVERVSYPVITPSAARGILEAILMKPVEKLDASKRQNKTGFRWHILRLGVIREGVLMPILRNELGYESHPAYGNARGFDIADKRAQRHSLILSGGTDDNGNRAMLDYLIEACLEVEEGLGLGGNRNGQHHWKTLQVLAKYHQMFLRRARTGQSFYQPFFGCREFSVAEWEIIEDFDKETCNWCLPADVESQMRKINKDFGFIFRDFNFGRFWKDFDNSSFDNETGMPRLTAARSLKAKADEGWISVKRIENGKVVDI